MLKQTCVVAKLIDSNGEETAELERLSNVYASQHGGRAKGSPQNPAKRQEPEKENPRRR
jgi:hypothetical protein